MPESLGPPFDISAGTSPTAPSAYWGDEKIWDTRANNHNSMFDKKGRLWLAASIRGHDNPDFCKEGSDHPSAKVFPLDKSPRQAAMLDPKSMKYTFVDTCFGTHHAQFGYDADETGGIVGVNLATSYLRPDGRQHADTPVDLVIEHLEHILKHVGEDGVGFGSDFDGAKVPAGVGNAAGLQNLVEIMRRRGYGEPLIEKLCHRNWLRVLGQTWGRAHTP